MAQVKKGGRKASVKIEDAVDAICEFSEDLTNGEHLTKDGLPPYTGQFYKNVSQFLNAVWKPHNVYTYLREDRKNLKTLVFARLGIKDPSKEKDVVIESETSNEPVNIYSDNDEDDDDDGSDVEVDNSFRKLFQSKDNDTFDLCVRNELWKEMEPVQRSYNGREILVLTPGVWSDIIADEFYREFRLPCAFVFKFSRVSENPENPYVKIQGRCKSKKCNNEFLGFIQEKPIAGSDVWMKVGCRDTRGSSHEPVKRQLRNKKRSDVGKEVAVEGAANYKRKLALKYQNLGDVEAPIVYSSDVLRKLIQEVNDKKLGVESKDENDPGMILKKLKYTSKYAGSIHDIGNDKFFLIYHLPEQIFIYKEYCKLFKDFVTVSIDSTGSLVLPLQVTETLKSPHIFLYEVVINFLHTTVSVGQLLSASQTTNKILFFLNEWLTFAEIKPKEIVCDYSRALLGAISRSFNHLSIQEHIQDCFFVAQKQNDKSLVGVSYIRIDVAHLIAIFCRQKYFTARNKAVKDFLIRCVALMVSSESLEEFREILLLTLTICIHQYGGQEINSSVLSPAEEARIKLIDLIRNAKHDAIDLVPDEDSQEFKMMIAKLSVSGLDPNMADLFLNTEPESAEPIKNWISNIKLEAEKNKKTVYDRPNPYYLPGFYKHVSNLSVEFPIWTAVMRRNFHSNYIRPSSSNVEGDFNQLKNNVLKNVQGALRVDKFFKIHHEALKGQCLLASAKIAEARMLPPNKITDPRQKLGFHLYDESNDASNNRSLISSFDENENHFVNAHSSKILTSSNIDNVNERNEESSLGDKTFTKPTTGQSEFSEMNLVAGDLYEVENWRNKVKKEDFFDLPSSQNNNGFENDLKQNGNAKKRLIEVNDRKPSKYFKQFPEIKSYHTIASGFNKKFTCSSNKWLLCNGSKRSKPQTINQQKYMIKNTCQFDACMQILH